MFEDDVWAQQALPALAAAGDAPQPPPAFARQIDPSLDHLSWAGLDGRFASLGQMCNAFARRDRAPSRELCLVATVRNEGLYLLEWIAYHRALGVSGFFIYSNNNDDGSDALLAALVQAGIINWIRNDTSLGGKPQYKAYGHAFQLLPEILCYRWAGVLDLDEFIVLDSDRFRSIPEFIAAHETRRTDAIALSWVFFGSGAQTRRSGEPVTRRFLRRDRDINSHVKTLCRPASFIHSGCHHPIWDEFTAWTFRGATGDPHPQMREESASCFSPHPTDEWAWINHYHWKSAEEYFLRKSGNPGDADLSLGPAGVFFTVDYVQDFVERHTVQGQRVDLRAITCVPGLEDDIAALRRLPGVADAMAAIEAAYLPRLRAIAAALGTDPRFQAAESAERWFLEVAASAGSQASPPMPRNFRVPSEPQDLARDE